MQPAAPPGNSAESALDVNGTSATDSGWGRTETGAYSNTALREVTRLVTPTGSDWGTRPDNTVCGKYAGGKDSCNGDSGGPLAAAYNSQDDVFSSVSYGPAECRDHGAYTRVNGHINRTAQQTGVLGQQARRTATPASGNRGVVGLNSSISMQAPNMNPALNYALTRILFCYRLNP